MIIKLKHNQKNYLYDQIKEGMGSKNKLDKQISQMITIIPNTRYIYSNDIKLDLKQKRCHLKN